MGGDLIESSGARFHTIWWEYMEHNMNDILDAYSVHIYWNYWDIPRMEFRLKDVHRIVTQEIAPAAQKPTYVMEFGVRGANSFRGEANRDGRLLGGRHGAPQDEHRRLPAALVRHRLRPARLLGGVEVGRVLGQVYDNTLREPVLLDVRNGRGRLAGLPDLLRAAAPAPLDRARLAGRAGRAVGGRRLAGRTRPIEAEKELVAYASSGGAADRDGSRHARRADLNTVSAEKPQYSIGGLPADTSFNLALWNAAGNGESTPAGTVRSDAAGVARFEVPLHAAFSLTTVPVF